MKNQNGFTMIELVVVISILGILAAVAIPKYVDMRSEARVASANGVYGAAQSAAALNYAEQLVKASPSLPITTGTTLIGAMEGLPDGWIVDDTAPNLGICLDTGTADDCAGSEFIVEITTVGTGGTSATKAVLAKGGSATW